MTYEWLDGGMVDLFPFFDQMFLSRFLIPRHLLVITILSMQFSNLYTLQFLLTFKFSSLTNFLTFLWHGVTLSP